MEREAVGRLIVMGDRGTWLQRHPGHAADVEVHLDHVVGGREGPVGGGAIPEPGLDRNIVRDFVPDFRGAGRHGVVRVQHMGQHLVVDLDRLGAIERLRQGLGHHHGDGLAHMTRLVGRQQEMRADEDGAAARRAELHVVFGLGQRIVRDGTEIVGQAIGTGEDPKHARHGARARRIDAADAGMGMGRADHGRIGLMVELEVVAEAALAADEPLVLGTPHGLADEAEAVLVGFHAGHFRVFAGSSSGGGRKCMRCDRALSKRRQSLLDSHLPVGNQ